MASLTAFMASLGDGTCHRVGERCLAEVYCFIGPAGGEDFFQILAFVLTLPQLSLGVLVSHITHDNIFDHLFFSVDETAEAFERLAAFGEVTQGCFDPYPGLEIVDLLIIVLLQSMKLLPLHEHIRLGFAQALDLGLHYLWSSGFYVSSYLGTR